MNATSKSYQFGQFLQNLIKPTSTKAEVMKAAEEAKVNLNKALKLDGQPSLEMQEAAQREIEFIDNIALFVKAQAGRRGAVVPIQRLWPTVTGSPTVASLNQNQKFMASRDMMSFMMDFAKEFTHRDYQRVDSPITPVEVGAATAATPTAGDLSANSAALPGRMMFAPAMLIRYQGGFTANRSSLRLTARYNHISNQLAVPATQAARIAGIVNSDSLDVALRPTADATNAIAACECKHGEIPGWDPITLDPKLKGKKKKFYLPSDDQLDRWDAVLWFQSFDFGPISRPGHCFASFSNIDLAPASAAALASNVVLGAGFSQKDSAAQLFASVDLDPANIFGQLIVPGMPEFDSLRDIFGI